MTIMENKQDLFSYFLQFKNEPSVQAKKALTERICLQFKRRGFSEGEKNIVVEILSVLAKEAEVAVRKVLAETLKDDDNLPPSIAKQLAEDIEDVSIPILEFCRVLSEDDLIEIISKTENIKKLTTIAKRKDVTEDIATHLIDKKIEKIVKTLIDENHDKLSDNNIEHAMQTFPNSEGLMEKLLEADMLSAVLAEKIISKVSTNLQTKLVGVYNINPAIAKKAIRESSEVVTIKNLQSGAVNSKNASELVEHLYNTGKLSYSILLRSLCHRDIEFFEHSIAKLAKKPLENTKKILNDLNQTEFARLYTAAGMPSTMLQASFVMLKLIKQFNFNNPDEMIEVIIQKNLDDRITNMSYFLALLKDSKKAL